MARIKRPGETTPTPAPGSTTRKPAKRTHGLGKAGTKGTTKGEGGKTPPPSPDAGLFDPNRIYNTGQLYDLESSYGRAEAQPGAPTWDEFLVNQGVTQPKKLKAKKEARLQAEWQAQGGGGVPWFETEAGKAFAKDFPDIYSNSLMAEAGGMSGVNPIYGGATTFGQWMANDRQDEKMRAYDAARGASGGQLGFADYQKSIGWGPGAGNSFTAPTNTGNAFTSSSLPAPASAAPAQNAFSLLPRHQMRQLGPNRRKVLKGTYGPPAAPAPLAPFTPPSLSGSGGLGGLAADRMAFNSLTPQQRGINSAMVQRPGRWSVFN